MTILCIQIHSISNNDDVFDPYYDVEMKELIYPEYNMNA